MVSPSNNKMEAAEKNVLLKTNMSCWLSLKDYTLIVATMKTKGKLAKHIPSRINEKNNKEEIILHSTNAQYGEMTRYVLHHSNLLCLLVREKVQIRWLTSKSLAIVQTFPRLTTLVL
mmetsp:Transcript_2634/g.3935  ORF Transcript_2634/g.3935 Transcript_2634/m.3935 type:complete len:117 (+) Transcript_2634:60-410(+)